MKYFVDEIAILIVVILWRDQDSLRELVRKLLLLIHTLFAAHKHDLFETKYQSQLKVLEDYAEYNESTISSMLAHLCKSIVLRKSVTYL